MTGILKSMRNLSLKLALIASATAGGVFVGDQIMEKGLEEYVATIQKTGGEKIEKISREYQNHVGPLVYGLWGIDAFLLGSAGVTILSRKEPRQEPESFEYSYIPIYKLSINPAYARGRRPRAA